MKKIFIIDASGYLYRSYFAIKQMTNSKGESTNAIYGFIRSVQKLIKDFNPTHLVSVFDGPRNAIKRTAIYPDYKAHRQEMPKDLLHQIFWAKDCCRLMGIPELMIPEVEADDTMGSVAVWAEKWEATAYLCTSDKDMCQLVNDHIFVLNTFKDNLIVNAEEVEKQFGVRPDQMIDYLSITGDASDNVPGLPGFGHKTAAELLKKFGTLDYILDHPKDIPGAKKQETLINDKDKALISRQLVTIDTAVEIPEDPEFYRLRSPSLSGLKAFYTELNFSSLIRELETLFPSSETTIETIPLNYQLVDDEASLSALVDSLKSCKKICVDTETTSLEPMKAELVGIGMGTHPGTAWYVPVNGQLGLEKVLKALKPLFSDPNIAFYGHNIKYDRHVLLNHGIEIAQIDFDTMIASYLLNSHSRQHSLDALALTHFDKVKVPISDLIGKGKHQLSMKDIPLDKIAHYCCEDVDYTIRLRELFVKELDERGLTKLMTFMEVPLLTILFKMERKGIFVDTAIMAEISKELAARIGELEQSIYALAGETFNLNSPKQLSQILFEKMGITPPKKTATGFSTNADVLEGLKEKYPIASQLLEYRELEKLRSTYADSLPQMINPHTHRIHCTFNQTVAATGRLASQDPNLQNIPVRSEIGKKIRQAFRPQKAGWSYLAADYSQIELRLLAHLSEEPALVKAFLANEDIHNYTASLIFDIPIDQVNAVQRNQAKTVNFGIIYGQQAFGLSQELKIDTKTAATFIQMYFERYPGVKHFLESCKASARLLGKAVTLLGRERLIPEINSQNGMIRTAAERLAINTPLQGTAADLIKLAMLEIDARLKREGKKSFMILQIHDELIFEVPDEELEAMKILVKEEMENVMQLKVPLIVDIEVGKNWKEC